MLLIKNGYLMDPASGLEGNYDILIDEERIAKIGFCGSLDDLAKESAMLKLSEQAWLTQMGQQVSGEGITEIDAAGCIVAPGLVDAHVHFRDPGFTEKEDIYTGAEAAKAGGFTSVVMMGNTNPHFDSGKTIDYALKKGNETGINVFACGNITKGMEGTELTDFDELIREGAVLFTDDGKPITDAETMRKACMESKRTGKVLSLHEEDPSYISENGINAGPVAESIGLKGSPRDAEISMVKRDIEIAKETGAEITIQHISTKEAVSLIREAKKIYPGIHAEATPHHFTLTENAVAKYGTMAKMNPPLRTEEDRMAIIEGIADGTIETIATDHAPHTKEEKEREFSKAPSGIIGLETSLGLGIRELVKAGHISLMTLLSKMTCEPAQVYGLETLLPSDFEEAGKEVYESVPVGRIMEGGAADLVIFNVGETKKHDTFVSKASNSPFVGEELPGRIKFTICRGSVVYKDEK